MKLIVGLGNPGLQYEHTRHNIGFRVVDKLATKLGWQWSERRSRAILTSGMIGTEKVVLAKPITYMNLSGESIAELLRWYKLQPADMLVVCDDLDLPVGKVRLRTKGSAGGQHGLENIIARLHTNDFPRLRIGIGRPFRNRPAPTNYLLSAPSTEDRILLEAAEDRAVEAILLIITQGLEAAMNVVNADPEAEQKAAEKRRLREERREQERLRKETEQQAHSDDPSKGGESGLSPLTT